MKVTLRIEIPDQILVSDIKPPTDQEWQSIISSYFRGKLSSLEARAKGQIKPSADIAEQSPEAEKAYQDALDTLGKMVEANRKLKTPGITVEINRD